jgi:hypothetical protein
MKFFPRRHQQSEQRTAGLSETEERTRLTHLMVTAQLVGKSALGIGFLVSIYGVTDHQSWAIRTGLALLLTGMVASFTSLVHSFNRRRLTRQSTSGSARGSSNSRPDPP